MSEKGPNSTSSDYDAMKSYWDWVSPILEGADAMRSAGELFLPKFPHEDNADYDFRRKNAKFSNIFGDIVETLAAKPFAEELTVDGTNEEIEKLLGNIDGQGNHVHVFAANSFYHGIANAIDWILVDYSKNVPENATIAVEKQMGVRPYWVHVEATRLIAVYSEIIGGVSVITHARMKADTTERQGYGEITKERVRVFDRVVIRNEQGDPIKAEPATWQLWEKQETTNNKKEWVETASGKISIEVIPLVPFIAGRRKGASWQIKPPLKDAAHLQIEHYQQENGLKSAKEATAFPMLAANGVEPPVGEDGETLPVSTGPKVVLFAPPGGDGQSAGSFTYVEPNAHSLKFLSEDNKDTEKQLRELGRQPLTAQAGNITTITAAFAGDKAHTVIEAWAINFKDTIENAVKLTGLWLNQDLEPQAQINTDFSLALKEDDGSDTLDKMRDRGDLSQATYWAEHKRRGNLSPNFDPEAERELILEEIPGDDDDDDIADALPPKASAAA